MLYLYYLRLLHQGCKVLDKAVGKVLQPVDLFTFLRYVENVLILTHNIVETPIYAFDKNHSETLIPVSTGLVHWLATINIGLNHSIIDIINHFHLRRLNVYFNPPLWIKDKMRCKRMLERSFIIRC